MISDAPKVASATQEPTTATPATEPPAPKPDHHTERQAIQVYWNHVINSLAIANEATVAASTFVQNADLVSASQMLKQGRGATEQAKEMSQKDVPDGYNEIASTLLLASNDFADAITKESDYLDSSTPSVGAEALSKKQSALSQIEDAQHAARLKYVELGGKIDDLESFAGAAKATDDLMKVLSK